MTICSTKILSDCFIITGTRIVITLFKQVAVLGPSHNRKKTKGFDLQKKRKVEVGGAARERIRFVAYLSRCNKTLLTNMDLRLKTKQRPYREAEESTDHAANSRRSDIGSTLIINIGAIQSGF